MNLIIKRSFMNVFVPEESVTIAKVIKTAKQCESFTIVVYVSKPMGNYGRFHSLTRFINLHIAKVSHQEFVIMSKDFVYSVL